MKLFYVLFFIIHSANLFLAGTKLYELLTLQADGTLPIIFFVFSGASCSFYSLFIAGSKSKDLYFTAPILFFQPGFILFFATAINLLA